MHKYRLIAKKGEGTFSEVLKAQSIKNGKYVAIKCMKNHFDSLEQVNNLREIQALRRLSPHPNVIRLVEVLYDQPTGRLALVFELMDMNAYELIRGRRHYLPENRVKHYIYQLLRSMDHMHRNGIFHRDIKPENILLMDDELKLADFGSCRGIYSKQPYTEYISTRWYRAPECLLTDGYYNYKMDMWGVGCVFFEIMALYPLFPGTNELDQIQKIHNIIGTPSPEVLAKMKKHSNAHIDFNFPYKEGTPLTKLIPHASGDCIDLITKLLAYDPDHRISARQALRHQLFREIREAEKRAHAMNQTLSQSVSVPADGGLDGGIDGAVAAPGGGGGGPAAEGLGGGPAAGGGSSGQAGSAGGGGGAARKGGAGGGGKQGAGSEQPNAPALPSIGTGRTTNQLQPSAGSTPDGHNASSSSSLPSLGASAAATRDAGPLPESLPPIGAGHGAQGGHAMAHGAAAGGGVHAAHVGLAPTVGGGGGGGVGARGGGPGGAPGGGARAQAGGRGAGVGGRHAHGQPRVKQQANNKRNVPGGSSLRQAGVAGMGATGPAAARTQPLHMAGGGLRMQGAGAGGGAAQMPGYHQTFGGGGGGGGPGALSGVGGVSGMGVGGSSTGALSISGDGGGGGGAGGAELGGGGAGGAKGKRGAYQSPYSQRAAVPGLKGGAAPGMHAKPPHGGLQ